eukprot:scaffold19574_cov112-Isochrysis_galbana.AAC.2
MVFVWVRVRLRLRLRVGKRGFGRLLCLGLVCIQLRLEVVVGPVQARLCRAPGILIMSVGLSPDHSAPTPSLRTMSCVMALNRQRAVLPHACCRT